MKLEKGSLTLPTVRGAGHVTSLMGRRYATRRVGCFCHITSHSVLPPPPHAHECPPQPPLTLNPSPPKNHKAQQKAPQTTPEYLNKGNDAPPDAIPAPCPNTCGLCTMKCAPPVPPATPPSSVYQIQVRKPCRGVPESKGNSVGRGKMESDGEKCECCIGVWNEISEWRGRELCEG